MPLIIEEYVTPTNSQIRYILLKLFTFKELLIQVGMVGVAGIAQSLIVSEQWEGAGVFKEVEQS